MGNRHSHRHKNDEEFGNQDIDALMLKFEMIDTDHDGCIEIDDILKKIPNIHDNMLVLGFGVVDIFFYSFYSTSKICIIGSATPMICIADRRLTSN